MYPVILFIIATIYAAVKVSGHSGLSGKEKIAIYLKSLIFFNIGMNGLVAFLAHAFFADITAAGIGWAPGSPFQSEIAAGNLGMAVTGLLSPLFPAYFWLATVLNNVIFVFGATIVHYQQWMLGNAAPYNTGVFVWAADIVFPIIYGGLMLFYYIKYLRTPERVNS